MTKDWLAQFDCRVRGSIEYHWKRGQFFRMGLAYRIVIKLLKDYHCKIPGPCNLATDARVNFFQKIYRCRSSRAPATFSPRVTTIFPDCIEVGDHCTQNVDDF